MRRATLVEGTYVSVSYSAWALKVENTFCFALRAGADKLLRISRVWSVPKKGGETEGAAVLRGGWDTVGWRKADKHSTSPLFYLALAGF